MTKFRIFPHSGDSVEPQAPGIVVYTWSDEDLSSQRYFYSEIEAATDYLMTAIEQKFEQIIAGKLSKKSSRGDDTSGESQIDADDLDDGDFTSEDRSDEVPDTESAES